MCRLPPEEADVHPVLRLSRECEASMLIRVAIQ
jgi:hypothetical protein